MKQRTFTGKAATRTRSISQSDSSAGQNAVSIAPPGYGIDFIDSDQAAMPLQKNSESLIQAKLKIGRPGNKYEQEADRIAEQVMSMPEPRVQRTGICPECEEDRDEFVQTKPLAEQITPLVQRQIDPEEEEEEESLQEKSLLQRQVEEEEEEPIQAKQAGGQTPQASPDLGTQIRSLRGNGRPLPQSTRNLYELRFGYDFSKVRVHTDREADTLSRALSARSFTSGQEIFFRRGEYDAGRSARRPLLAHELTHVMQQSKSSVNTPPIQFQQAPQQQPEAQNVQQAQNALVTFTGTNFTGAAVQCDVNFVQHLQTIDTYAGNHAVQIHVISSFRQQQQAVTGAIVRPVTNSNHHAGHAIDMNVWFGGQFYNSAALGSFNTLPQSVQDFINDIRNDTDLRWGGDFSTPDVVHIDDGLNINDPATFQQRVTAVQAPAQAAQPATR